MGVEAQEQPNGFAGTGSLKLHVSLGKEANRNGASKKFTEISAGGLVEIICSRAAIRTGADQ